MHKTIIAESYIEIGTTVIDLKCPKVYFKTSSPVNFKAVARVHC
jgi:hypothetical protein